MAEGEAKKLAVQNGRLLGHQNHSQKIQHVVKIKQENMQLKTEVIRLFKKLLRLFVCSYVLLENLHLEPTYVSQVSRLSEELLKSKRQLGRTEERLAEAH